MAKVGRKDKYESIIKPHLKDINEWLNDGASEKNIAKKLGIAYSTWNNYKERYSELKQICDKPRSKLVDDLRSALIKKALGFKITNSKTTIKQELDEDGKPTGKRFAFTEKTTTEIPPDTTAIFGALNLYDDNYVKDRKDYELRKRDLELKEKALEDKGW